MNNRYFPEKYLVSLTTALLLSCIASAQLSVNLDATIPACNGYTNGSIQAMVTGGVGPYVYLWNNDQGGTAIHGVGAGSYSLTVTDAMGETASAALTLSEPPPLSAGILPQGFICLGNNGTFIAAAAGGTPPYSYNWSNGASAQTISNPDPGYYYVTVTDANGCSSVGGMAINEPLTTTVHTIDVICPLWCDGSAEAIISGGTGPYTFQWNTGATTQVIFPLPPGIYTVTVTDGNGCTSVASGEITEPAEIILDVNVQNPCSGNANATVNATGGTPPFTYEWSNGQTGQAASGLTEGVYFVTVTDANGCKKDHAVTISSGAVVVVTNAQDATCANPNSGSASAVVTSGIGPFSYLWSNGATTPAATNLSPGTYTVTVTDAAGCSDTGSVNISTSPAFDLSVSSTGGGCDGSGVGAATVQVTAGGIAPFTYQWNDTQQQTTQTAVNLAPGSYNVTVTDAQGCKAVETVQVAPSYPSVVLVVDIQNPCSGNADVTVNATGGTPPFSYAWSHGPTVPIVTGLAEGVYFVTVTDANGCTKDQSVTVSSGTSVTVNNIQNATCAGVPNGSATATAVGVGPFSYLWSNGETTATATSLDPGTYTVTVTDAAGCTGTAASTIGAFTSIGLSSSATPAGCNGSSLGTATVNVTSGGTAPFSYLWNDVQQQTTQTAVNLAQGSYDVTVTDVLGCYAVETIQVSLSNALSILVQVNNASCQNTADGGAEVAQVSGNAVQPLTYLWSNGATEIMIDSVLAGNYAVTVTDSEGCTGSVPVVVGSDAGIQADFTWSAQGCPGDTIEVALMQTVDFFPAGNQIVSWEWIFSDGQTADVPDPTVSFTDSLVEATLIVENETGCKDTVSQMLDLQSVFSIQLPANAMACLDDTISIQAIFNLADSLVFVWTTQDTVITILNSDGAEVEIITSDTGTYVVYVSVENQFGCVFQDSVTVMFGSPDVVFDPALVSHIQCDSLTVDFSNTNPFSGGYTWYFNYPDTAATSTDPNPSYTYPDTGTYIVALVPMLDCVTGIDSIPVTVGPPPMAQFSYEKGPCADSVVMAFTDESMIPDNIISWHWEFSNGDTSPLQNPVVTLDSSQILVATLTIEFGTDCLLSVSDTIAVNVFSPELMDTVIACLPNPMAELNPGGDSTLVYLWSPADGLDDPSSWNPTATVSETTTWMVTILDGTVPDACSAMRKVTVLVPDSIGLSSPADIFACEEGPDTLSVTTTLSSVDYLWSSQTSFSDTLSQQPWVVVMVTNSPATYFVKTTDEYGCTAIDSVMVGVYPVKAMPPTVVDVCLGFKPSVPIDSLMPGDSIIWHPSDPNEQTPLDTTDFVLTVINEYGCQTTDTVTVNVIDLNKLIEVTPVRDTILQGESVELSVIGDFDHLCTWTPDGGLDDPSDCNPTASPLITTIYQVEVEDQATGCRGSGQSEICVVSGICGEPLIFVPNAFTPNGDGLNDVLYVRGYNISRVVIFAIYNRWGEKVFESHSVDEGWDGIFQGRLATGDVYAYYLKVECQTGEEFFKKGNVTVIR